MSRGDDFPRYTYMMDFNPMDEDTPLRDYWQTTDDLDTEDAATIASLATQVLQSKSGYEYGDGMSMGMGVGVGIEVNEPGVVADYMYSESRSSPQSQYSTTLPTEPAESFRGLMDDHDRGVQMLEESAAPEYDFEPEAQGHESSHVHGIDEPTMLSREQDAPETFRSTLLSVAAEVDVTNHSSYSHEIEMSAAMTASRVVNGVLRRSYAGTPTEEVVNLQALQSHAPQLTPPISESRSVSVETPDYAEQEKEPTTETEDQHVYDEPEDTPMTKDDEGEDWEQDEGGETEEIEGDETEDVEGGEREEFEGDEREELEGEEREEDEGGERVQGEERETSEDEGDRKKDEVEATEGDKGGETEQDEMDEEEPTPDTGAQQQLITETNERPAADDDEELPLQETPRKRGRPRRSSAVEAPPALTSEQPTAVQIAEYEKDTHAENEEVESAVTDGADPSRAEEMPTGRRRGRPRRSEISEPATATATATAPTLAKRRPGRPPKVTDVELTLEAAPAAGRRGRSRSRKDSMVNAIQLAAIARALAPAEASAATTPHKSSMVDAATQTSPGPTQPPVAEITRTEVPSGRRGRPRKSDVLDTAQASVTADQEVATTLITSANAAPARTSSKRGRPRKSDMTDATQASTAELEQPTVEVAGTGAPSGRRGRPRKSDVAVIEVQDAVASVPRSSSRRGRPRKSDATSAAQASTKEVEPLADEASTIAAPAPSKRGRPRKSDTMGEAPASIEEFEPLAVEASMNATPVLSKRGRPRKSDMSGEAQASTEELEPLAVEAVVAVPRSSSRRRRPPKNDAMSAVQASTEEVQPEEVEPLAVEASMTAATAPSKRGRPAKRAALNATHTSTEKLQVSSAEAPATTTPVPSKRGRRRKSDAMEATPAEVPTHEVPLAVDEAPITATPASEGLPSEASVKISTTTPGRRGRLPKGVVPLLPTEIETLQTEDDIWAVDSPPSQSIGRRGRPLRQVDALEERDGSPSPLPKKRRGRGRPPKSESLLPAHLPRATVEPGLGMGAQQAESQELSTPVDDVSKDLDVGETASTPAQEDIEATPVRKRGRPKAVAVDKPLPVTDMLVTASEKKRGRRPRAIANIDSAEEQGRPHQSEVQEEEEEPAAKRRRTSNDVTMEDAVGEEEPQGNAQEDELHNVGDLGDAVAANGTRRKRSSVTWAQPLTSSLTSPQTGRRPRLSGEMLEESTKTKQVEQPPEAPPMPKTLFDMISDGRRMGRQKTYGKRSKR
ncbi:hypothetical protein H0G86_008706 [Trichoderma simmonsii]|uniref:AT hook domain-containing protein n=1 Tax=Trichoderma simmonsii TaxID=1491479 RepID=A0A8G0LG25_9HYPO|nr:hypothetical protein H0G86_008706 [Trichoderma simmonsii]